MTYTLRATPGQRRSVATIAAILGAAEDLVIRDGQVKFTAAELAEQADVSIGRVYYWFADLDAVMLTLREKIANRVGTATTVHDADVYIVNNQIVGILALVGTEAERAIVLDACRDVFGYLPLLTLVQSLLGGER